MFQRTVITRAVLKEQRSDDGGQKVPDDYKNALLKLIPAEVITFYLGASNLISATVPTGSEERFYFSACELLWGLFCVLLICTPLYLWRVGKVEVKLQLLISMVSFALWVFVSSGPFDCLAIDPPVRKFYGTLVMMFFVFASPMLFQGRGPLPGPGASRG